jgi:hypothetical protein
MLADAPPPFVFALACDGQARLNPHQHHPLLFTQLFLLCLRAEKLENVAKLSLPVGYTYVMDVSLMVVDVPVVRTA